MENLLFSGRSITTMLHGIVLGGGSLLGLAAALFGLIALRTGVGADAYAEDRARALTRLLVVTAVLMWLAVIVGTYITFPPYRATPPEGAADLGAFPRALILSSPQTRWLHAFAMEVKEHVPWIAAMLASAVAFVSVRYRARLLSEPQLRRTATTLLVLCFILVAAAAMLGTFVNKVAPLE